MTAGRSLEFEPVEKARHYLALNMKYLQEAEELLKQKDYVQASEKLWGAAAEILKVVAARRGAELKSHRELFHFVVNLSRERDEPGLIRLFSLASALHQNFYEHWLPPETVEDHADAVRELVAKLRDVR